MKEFADGQTCKPLFLFYHVRAAPASPVEAAGGCCLRPSRPFRPWILTLRLVQDKVLIGKVQGANAPEISSMVADNIPEVPEE